MNINGVQIRESVLAVSWESNRKHNRRKGSSAYHSRIQKKWDKRFGRKEIPGAYMINGTVLGFGGDYIIAHPSIVAKLKEAAK